MISNDTDTTITFSDTEIALICVAGVSSLLASAISFVLIWNHIHHYDEPDLQRQIIRIIFMIPVYAISSFLCLPFPAYADYINTFRDCYEAYVLWTFLSLLISVLGGEVALEEVLEKQPKSKHPAPFCCLKFQPGRSFLRLCKQMILQYVWVLPALSFLSVILTATNTINANSLAPDSPTLWMVVVENISVTFSLYYLVLFYMVTKELLVEFRPMPKFMCIKTVIFFSFWQDMLISGLVFLGWIPSYDGLTPDELGTCIQDWLICIEMLPIAIAHAYGFGYSTFKSSDVKKVDIFHEIKHLLDAPSPTTLSNIKDVMNPSDMFVDTKEAFYRAKKYHMSVIVNFSNEDLTSQVLKQGWLLKRGEIRVTWRKRFCLLLHSPPGMVYFRTSPFENWKDVLNNPRNLAFPVDYLRRPLGFVDFYSVKKITPKVEEKGSNHPEFSVETGKRTWQFKSRDEADFEEWVEKCQNLLSNMPPPTKAEVSAITKDEFANDSDSGEEEEEDSFGEV
eukprot:TRINITY_DN2373_c0_g2_i1.p1 TRINITY_DN2373_c0_g2~~TRINITY_DN2373_c0_g2_i1.p1  ORF type:complete len:507 (-),score=78.59 TRINITY_DN2373_c0_g2_i1:160-1680(-)